MIEIPEWLAKLPKSACVNIDEFSKLIGVNKTTIQYRYSNGVYSTSNQTLTLKSPRGLICMALL